MIKLNMNPQDLKQIGALIDSKMGEQTERLEAKMFIWKSEIIDAVDVMAKEITDERDFREITTQQIVNNRQRTDNLEKKVFGKITGTN